MNGAAVNPGRSLLVASMAVALAVPLGLAAPGAAQPSHRVLLGATDGLNQLAEQVAATGGSVVQSFEIAQALVADLPESAAVPQGAYVIPNVAMSFNALPSSGSSGSGVQNTFNDTIDAPESAGSGVKVAVIDTGVDPSADITVSDRVNVSGDIDGDGYGHGTFMAGLVAGDDADFGGVAPQSSVVDVQVAAQDGSTDLTRVLAGLQAVADHQASDPSLQVAMLALNTQSPLPPHLDPLTRGLNRLWDRGVTVVVASGNDGVDSMTSPATDPTLLVVGAQDEQHSARRTDDFVPDFSAYGKVFGAERPDVVAPGVSLVSASAPNSEAYLQNPGSRIGDGFLKGTGTSMSSAVAAGAAAALLADRPELGPNDVKRLFVGTAYKTSSLDPALGAGAGGLDLGAALSTPVSDVPELRIKNVDNPYGPDEADAQNWADFTEAWDDGDIRAAAAAWVAMSPQTRKWAATAWSVAAMVRALQADDDTWEGRRWGGRRWGAQEWEGRRWGTDEWVGRRWGNQEWLDSVWDGRRWGGAQFAASDWLAFAWTLRLANADDTILDMWEGRRWGDFDWVGRRWGSEAWEGRRWGSAVWDGRRWGTGEWDGRRWGNFAYQGRRWGNETWDGRRWGALNW